MKYVKNNKDIIRIMQVFVFAGITGFIYEELFYLIDMGKLIKRGITFGPWIPIYAIGAVMMMIICCRYKDKPIIIFLLGLIISGVVEFFTGFILHKFFDIRLWDYNNEILNFGNIGGYICLRSVLLFGFGCLFLIYKLIPFLDKINSSNRKFINILSYILFSLFIFDILLSLIF